MNLSRKSTDHPSKARGPRRGLAGLLALLPVGALMAASVAGPAAAQASSYKAQMPASAKAGDLTPFQPCVYKGMPTRGGDAAECATLVVAENRKKLAGRLIALPVVRLPALKPNALEPIFWLEGGPGGTNLTYQIDARTLAEEHDIYMLGYRGVDGTTSLQCPEMIKALTSPNPLSERGQALTTDAALQCAARLTASGIDLGHYAMVDVIEDHEALRTALGVQRANLISDSYGTRVAQYYARLHPTSLRRSVQLGVNPPGHFQWFPETTNEILREYAKRCAASEPCGGRTPDLFKTVVGTYARNDVTHQGAAVDMDKVRVGTFFLLFNKSTAVMVFDAAMAAEKGDNGGLARLAGLYDAAIAPAVVWGDFLSKGGGEKRGSERAYLAERRSSPSSFGSPADLVIFRAAKAWPTRPFPAGFDKVVRDETPTLLINGNLDVSTPVKYAEAELLPHLPNGHLVVLRDQGHEDWLQEQKPAMDRLLSGFFRDGAVDASAFMTTPVPFH